MDVKKLLAERPAAYAADGNGAEPGFCTVRADVTDVRGGIPAAGDFAYCPNASGKQHPPPRVGCGMCHRPFRLSVIGDAPERRGVLFDQIPPQIMQESVARMGLQDRAEVLQGNFLTDPVGVGYDLILAVSIMLFAKGNMEALLKKFYNALNPGGVLLIISEGIAPDFSEPWDMVTGYLPYYLNGMDMGVKKGEVPEAARKAGFTKVETRVETLCSGVQEIHVIRK